MLLPHAAHDEGAIGRHRGMNMADRWWESQRCLNEREPPDSGASVKA
jgi:hypothetical protein